MSENYESIFYRKTKQDFHPQEMIGRWEGLYESIEIGYDDVEPELEYDFLIRDSIEGLINASELKKFGQHEEFKSSIHKIDAKIKPLIFENPRIQRSKETQWWHFIILKKGGQRYVKEIKDLYKISIALVR